MTTTCSLEHCHTNLFALQSVNEMKWKCFRRATHAGQLEQYKDPVLVAYWRTLKNDTLCAWRRVPTDDGQRTERELWLFGINNELPSEFAHLRLMEAHGSWSNEAMSYDCRSMLFKALHNMIEKYLLSRGFARLNKWFVLPVSDHFDVKIPHLSFKFNFFLHGESRVCATIDVQRHRSIFNLTRDDLQQSSPSNVILAPYGIAGMLIGAPSREIDIHFLTEHWERNYPVLHLDGLPDFVEVTTGGMRTFYPACYVYKVASHDEVLTASKNPVGMQSDTTKIARSLIQTHANNLLICAQRNNCIGDEKKYSARPNDFTSMICDPNNNSVCQCHQCLLPSLRSSTLVPFHRRPVVSDRHSVKPLNSKRPSVSGNTNDTLKRVSPTMRLPPPSAATHEKFIDSTASAPNSVGSLGPSSVLSNANNPNALQADSSVSSVPSNDGMKRSAAMAFDDDEAEHQRQTYDFYRTDSFLQQALKRFRTDEPSDSHPAPLPIATTTDHIYRNGQPTPPSPSSPAFARNAAEYDEGDGSVSRLIHSSDTPATARPTSAFFQIMDGPSMADLDTIIELRDETKTKEPTHHVSSPSRKENLLQSTGMTPIPPAATNPGNTLLGNKSFNGEHIYNTPPGSSSSSDKLHNLHSPYGIAVDSASHAATTFDTLHQLSQESIIVPFDSSTVIEQTGYAPKTKLTTARAHERYEPSNSSPSSPSTRHWKRTLPTRDLPPFSPAHTQPSSNRQQPTPRSVPLTFSPIRSLGSIPSVNSPIVQLSSTLPELDSLLMNIFLNDSILNIFRDINFDSSVLCACTPHDLSIHGDDALIYLERSRQANKSAAIRQSSVYPQLHSLPSACSCGFSAVVNLRYSSSSGLFYEDEVEITGVKTERGYRSSPDVLSAKLLEFIERQESSVSPFDPLTWHRLQREPTASIPTHPFFQYENRACRSAANQARTTAYSPVADELDKHQWLHPWSYTAGESLESDQQLAGMLRSLQPLLAHALKKPSLDSSWNVIDGPLTWKSFHQLLHEQSQHAHLDEQISGPQPIPYVLAGLERESIMLAPYGLKFWDKLGLEPYAKRKDIVYIAVLPDNDYICAMTKIYLRELSTQYELCRLGLHRSFSKEVADHGLLRLSDSSNDLFDAAPTLPFVDPWFTDHETSHPLGGRLKLYAQLLQCKLAYILSNPLLDSALVDEVASQRDMFRVSNDTPASSSDLHSTNHDAANHLPSRSPSSANGIASDASTVPSNGLATSNTGAFFNGQQVDPTDLRIFESFQHGRSLNDDQAFLVIYLIDTFRYELTESSTGSIDETLDVHIRKAIFRAYMDLIKNLPEKISIRIHIQIIPFESIVQQQMEADVDLRSSHFKRLAFHVYEQLRRTVSHTVRAKSLTDFGPAASEAKSPAKLVMQLYTPAYILSPKSDFRFKSFVDVGEQSSMNGSILFCSYCLSDDQRYLLASCSDDRGELLETCSIQIEVPDRHRRKVQYARRIGLQKLWDFILRLVMSTTMPWRIVIDRLGRIGHGELKGWGIILSKRNLVRCATLIRESCPMCHSLRSHDHPVILSACLVSMETHSSLAILPRSMKAGEERSSQPSTTHGSASQGNGHAFNDISMTHILTFPTSASVQHVRSMARLTDSRQLSNDIDEDLFDAFFPPMDGDGLPGEPFGNMPSPPPGDLDFSSNYPFDTSHTNGSYSRLNSLSSSQPHGTGQSVYGNLASATAANKSSTSMPFDSQVDFNDTPLLNQQPLALGYYVSTIGTLNPLPAWMLNGKPSPPDSRSSSVFKATLYVNVPNAQHSDDMLFGQNHDQKSIHPLDSNYTYVILRHVLEGYHRLSWLLIDAKTNERASCLPVHVERLLKLYHAFVKFV